MLTSSSFYRQNDLHLQFLPELEKEEGNGTEKEVEESSAVG